MGATNQDPTALAEASQMRGLSPLMRASINDMKTDSGTNLREQIALSDINIANINETIADTEVALRGFSDLFNTDDAKGISANINKMAKGLSDAAGGLIGVPDATSALNTATTETVKLAEKAADVFKKTDTALSIADVRLDNLNERLFKIEQELGNQ
tara:strand:- start:52 stop:522 length:471 start_codon:yes stop_codon:yes gene_type:complete